MVKCDKCGEEIICVRSTKTGIKYNVNVGKKPKDKNYFHWETCKGLDRDEPDEEESQVAEEQKQEEQKPEEQDVEESKPEESEEEQPKEEVPEQKPEDTKQEVTIMNVLNNHELRIRELEGIVSKMLQHFGRVYLEGEKK